MSIKAHGWAPDTTPIVAVEIVAGALSTPLDGSLYRVRLSEDGDAGWSVPVPGGADPATTARYAGVVFLPPLSGGPFSMSIPVDAAMPWVQVGGLDEISLAAGDDPIFVSLSSTGDAIAFTAVQGVEVTA